MVQGLNGGYVTRWRSSIHGAVAAVGLTICAAVASAQTPSVSFVSDPNVPGGYHADVDTFHSVAGTQADFFHIDPPIQGFLSIDFTPGVFFVFWEVTGPGVVPNGAE